MASIGATQILLLLFAMIFPILLFQYQGNPLTTQAQSIYNNLDNNEQAIMNSAAAGNATGSYGTIFSPIILAASTFSALIQAFTVFPATAINVLMSAFGLGIPFPTTPGMPPFNLAQMFSLIILFTIAISAVSWLYGRFLNP